MFTAAFCFKLKNQVQLIDAIIGKIDDPGSANHNIWKIVTHPDSNRNLFDTDVSLVMLIQAVTLTDQVQPVCLPESSQTITTGTVVSWEFQKNISSLLLTQTEHSATIIGKKECIALSPGLKDAVTNQTFCARFKNQSKSSCNLDLGDSLFVESLEKFYVKGIFGYMHNGTHANCGMKTHVYIDIEIFSSWIYEELFRDVRYLEKTFDCVKDSAKNAQRIHCSEFESFPIGTSFKFRITSYELFNDVGTNFKNMKHLSVTKTSLKALKRTEITKLIGLETFKFTMNDVELLREDVFWDLKNLTNLSLKGNGLKNISANHFIKMENLKIIDLSSNQLEYLREDLFEKNLKLETISMSNNPLKEIFFDFTHLPSLSNLILKNAGCIDNEARSKAEVSGMVENICKNKT